MVRARQRRGTATLLAVTLLLLPITLAGHVHADEAPLAAACAACKVTHQTPLDLTDAGAAVAAATLRQRAVPPALAGHVAEVARIVDTRGPPGPLARTTP